MKTVLITGASSGLGAALARRFAATGRYRIYGVSRHRPDDITGFAGYYSCDLSLPESTALLAQELKKDGIAVDILVNNAGVGAYGTWSELPMDELRKLMEIDFFAPVALTRELLPDLRSRKGAVINISSVAGKVYVPCMGAYNAAKFSLAAFSRTLRIEEAKNSVRVMTVYPGRIGTGFSTRACICRPATATPGSKATSAEEFAACVVSGFERGKEELLYPWWYCFFRLFVAIAPGFYAKKCRQLWKI